MRGRVRNIAWLVALWGVGPGCQGAEGPPASGVPGPAERLQGALTVGGCACKSWQPGVTCEELTYGDIPPDNKYYVTTFGGPGDGQDMWVCGHKTTDNGSWPYAAGYSRFGCGKIKVLHPTAGASCIAEVADCGPNRCVEEAACFCNCQGHHPILDVSPFITKYMFGISSSGWSEKRVVIAYPVDPATPIGCPGGPEPRPDADGDGHPASQDCEDHDAAVHPGAQEKCDGRDNDCDGLTDEGVCVACVPGEVRPCTLPGRGAGVMVCTQEAVYGPCVAAAPAPEAAEAGVEDAADQPEDTPRNPAGDLAEETAPDGVAPGRPDVPADLGSGPEDQGLARPASGAGGCRAGMPGGVLPVLPWLWWIRSRRRKGS